MQILKLDKTPIAPSQKLSQLYLSTNGASPSECIDKAVMISALNIDDALMSVKHKITREYLNEKEPTLWRLGAIGSEPQWVKVDDNNEYYHNVFKEVAQTINKLKAAFQEDINELTKTKVLKAIIKDVYVKNTPSLRSAPAVYMLEKAFELSGDMNSKVFFKKLGEERLSRRNAFTMTSIKALICDLVDRELVISHKSKFDADEQMSLEGEAHQHGTISYGTKQYPEFYYRIHSESDLPPLLEKDYELQKPLWKIEIGESEKFFTDLNLSQSDNFAELIAQQGSLPVRQAIHQDIVGKKDLSSIFDSKAHLNADVVDAAAKLKVSYLNHEAQWQTFNASKLPDVGRLTSEQRETYTLARKASLAMYGHTGLMGLFVHPLNRYSEPLTNRVDLDNWVKWCDEHEPEFTTYDELHGKEAKPYVQKRKRSVEVKHAVMKRHQTDERQKELEVLFEKIAPTFNEALDVVHKTFGFDVESTELTAIFDTQNKFKEFYVTEEEKAGSRHWFIEVNLGCHFNKVNIELDDSEATILYKNATLEIDKLFTVEQYAYQKAIECIVEELMNKPKEILADMLNKAGLDQNLVAKKRLLMTAFTKKLMSVVPN
ncbi:hypothetical protein [Vibrio agarivorans]|uniref:hypothetical protein n=1 Tax=Vibrio agarivorans TaxID=153622 RepID=UPI0025B62810|nr:hypothetical protein [Vibrio agarivorans]MDN3661171.1 hypothetical protein [Vibrio agarivorans]